MSTYVLRPLSRRWARCWIVLGATLASVSAPARAQCPVALAPAVNYPAGSFARFVAVGDFNDDSVPDLAVANWASNTLSVMLGRGDGTLRAATSYPTGEHPSSVAADDLDGDGIADLAAANEGSYNVSIFRGNGDGTFQAAVNYAAGGPSYCVVVGDFNADGSRDLAVANGGLCILMGNGDGTFQAPAVSYAVATSYSAAIGDFNADGRQDIALAGTAGNNATILLGNGNGSFQEPLRYTLPANFVPTSVALGDLDDDGSTDVVVGNYGSGSYSASVHVLLGNGDGTLRSAVGYPAGANPRSVSVVDLNGDGHLDLATANAQNNTVSVLLGEGDGTFQAPLGFAADYEPVFITAADLDGDGRPDLVAANYQGHNLSILLNTSAAYISQHPSSQVVQAGQSLMLCVVAEGGGVLRYQWHRDGTPLIDGGTVSGATSPTLTISPTQVADTGSYDVQVSAPACGSAAIATSDPAVVAVIGPAECAPTVSQIATAQPVLSGRPATFFIAAAGPPAGGPLSYQWRRNGSPLANGGPVSGATSPTLIINPTALSDNGAAFDCIVANACGSTRSDPVGLGVVNSCPADFNLDGAVNSQDFFDFLHEFFAGCP